MSGDPMSSPSPADAAPKLLPCPFCGEPAEMDTARGFREMVSGKISHAVAVYCTSCSADMCFCRPDMPDLTTADLVYLAREQWNRRASETARAAAEERVKELERLDDRLSPEEAEALAEARIIVATETPDAVVTEWQYAKLALRLSTMLAAESVRYLKALQAQIPLEARAEAAEAQAARLREALEDIKRATVEGRVCDDVAWYDGITTLYDFCDLILNPPTPTSQEGDGRG